ncbi:MAG: hypothetical protein WKG07_24755 [Hymenobacter sp.]
MGIIIATGLLAPWLPYPTPPGSPDLRGSLCPPRPAPPPPWAPTRWGRDVPAVSW